MTREELLDRMTYAEFLEWHVLEQVEPFGETASYWRAGMIASTLANIHRGRDHEPYSPTDFIPKLERPRMRRQTGAEQAAFWKMICAEQEAIVARQQGLKNKIN